MGADVYGIVGIAVVALLYAFSVYAANKKADLLISRWRRYRRLRTGGNWPVAQGYVAQVEESRNRTGRWL